MDILVESGDVLGLCTLGVKSYGLCKSFLCILEKIAFESGLGDHIELKDTGLVVIEVLVCIMIYGVVGAADLFLIGSENLLLAEENLDLSAGSTGNKVYGRLVVRADIGLCEIDPGSDLSCFLCILGCCNGFVHEFLGIRHGLGLCIACGDGENQGESQKNLFHNQCNFR